VLEVVFRELVASGRKKSKRPSMTVKIMKEQMIRWWIPLRTEGAEFNGSFSTMFISLDNGLRGAT
jgi:hypothetical protein